MADVVVIGAGFAGLAAATELRAAGRSVIVLEARDRVGGKVESSIDSFGRRFDSGGQYVADEMTEVRALIAASEGHLVPHGTAGEDITVPAEWHHDWGDGESMYEALAELDPAPADRWLHEWLDEQSPSEGAAAAMRSVCDSQMCMDHRDLGLAHAAHQLRRTPSVRAELQYSVDRTMHSVAEYLARDLDVRCDAAALSVRAVDGGFEVRTNHGTVGAGHVIVATPPSVVGRIEFDPPLPTHVSEAAAAFRAADVLKIVIRYAHPFWLAAGSNGTIRFATPLGLYAADASVPAAPALVVFVGGPLASRWRASDPAALALEHLAGALGDAALHPTDVQLRDWGPDEWGGGGYCQFVPGLGAPTQIDTLRRGAPGITFASTELAEAFPGYVEGAIRAGRRAAADALHPR